MQWNVNALLLESAQAREDRKKRVRYLIRHFLAPDLSYPFLSFMSVNRKSSSAWQSFKHSMAAHRPTFNLPQDHYHLPPQARLRPSHNPNHLFRLLYRGKCRHRKGKACRGQALGHRGLGQE